MRIYIAIFVILMLTTLLLTILYKSIPVKSDEVQAEEVQEEEIDEEKIPDSDSDSDSEDEDEILNGSTQGSSIKPPRDKSPPKINQPQPIAPIRLPVRPTPPPARAPPLIPPTPPPASLEPLPPTPPAPAPAPPRPTPTYTVSFSVKQKTMTVNITNIKNAHNSFVITFHGAAIPAGPNRKYEYPETDLKTYTLADGETSFTFAVTVAYYGSYDYIVKLNGEQTDTFTAIHTEPLPPAPPPPDQYQWVTHNKKYHPFSALNGKFVNSDDIPGKSTSDSRLTDISIDDCKEVCDELEYCNSIQYTSGNPMIKPRGSKCYITSATVAGTGKPEDTSYFAQNDSGTKIFQKSITKSYTPPPPASLEPLPPTPPPSRAPPPSTKGIRYVWFGYEDSDYNRPLNIREIEVYSGGVNIVKGFGGDTVDSVSGFYNDGNEFPPQQLFDQQTSSLNFGHTNDAKTNYFKIDLGKEYSVIDKVLVYNRTDCCHDRWAGSFVKLLDTNGNEIKRSEKLPSNRGEAENYKEGGIRVKTFKNFGSDSTPSVTTSTFERGMYVSEKQANDAAGNYLKNGSDKRAEFEADIAKTLTSSGAGSFTASDISVVKTEVNRTGRRIWSLSITVEIAASPAPAPSPSASPPSASPPSAPPLYQPPTLQLESGKIIKVVEKEFTIIEPSSRTVEREVRSYADSIREDSPNGERQRRILINDYIKKQKESDKNFINAEYVGASFRLNESGRWYAYMKVNVSEIGDSPEEIQRKKDEVAEAKKKLEEEQKAEQRRKQMEEVTKINLETENKLYKEYPTMKKSILKEILGKSFHHLPSARTEVQKLIDAEVAAVQTTQKKLEEEQKAATEAAAAASAVAAAIAAAAAVEAKKKLEEEQKAAVIAAAKKKIEDAKLEYGSETWNAVILGKRVNTKSVLNYEQLQTIKISPTTTFYDIMKNNIVWFNLESVKYLIWSISNDDTYMDIKFMRNKLLLSDKTTRIVDVCWDNTREEMKCENKTVYIKMNYNQSELNQSIGKELMTPVIGIPIYTFTTFPDGKWFKMQYNQTNKTYSFKKILQTPSEMRGIQSVQPDMLYKRKFYDDGIYRFIEYGMFGGRQSDIYNLSEFIIKTVDDKYVMYTKDDKLISGMRSGTSWEKRYQNNLISNPVAISKDKVNKTDYENAKFGLLGAMPFLHSFSNNGEIVPNKKYYSPNKKYYAIFIPNDGLYTKDAESDKYKVRIRTPNSTSAKLYSSTRVSGGNHNHSLIFYKDNESAPPSFPFLQRVQTEKSISLDTKEKRRNFAVMVTDLGELLCLDLYGGKIANDFGRTREGQYKNAQLAQCRKNDPDENSNPSDPIKYLVNKGTVTSLQKVENKDIYDSWKNIYNSTTNLYFDKNGAVNNFDKISGQEMQNIWIDDCKDIRVIEPIIKPYIEQYWGYKGLYDDD